MIRAVFIADGNPRLGAGHLVRTAAIARACQPAPVRMVTREVNALLPAQQHQSLASAKTCSNQTATSNSRWL